MDRKMSLHRLPRRDLLASTILMVASRTLGGAVVSVLCGASPAEPASTVTLKQFLALSSLLTGVSGLDPDLGKTYLTSLQAKPDTRAALAALIQRSGVATTALPRTLDQLSKNGVFQDKALRTVADTALAYWFTGTYDTPSGPRVATYTSALAWTTSFTKAMSLCGGATGYWAARPKS